MRSSSEGAKQQCAGKLHTHAAADLNYPLAMTAMICSPLNLILPRFLIRLPRQAIPVGENAFSIKRFGGHFHRRITANPCSMGRA